MKHLKEGKGSKPGSWEREELSGAGDESLSLQPGAHCKSQPTEGRDWVVTGTPFGEEQSNTVRFLRKWSV